MLCNVCIKQYKNAKAIEILYLYSLWGMLEVKEYNDSSKKPCTCGGHMYKFERYRQLGLADFIQPVGLK